MAIVPSRMSLTNGRYLNPASSTGAVADMFDGMVSALIDTRIEPDLEDILWGLVNVFHNGIQRVERELDDNEVAQKRMQREQDGSEVKSVELERTIAEGVTMIERRDTFEYLRDAAADQYRTFVKKPWLPRSGSKVNRKALTSAVIASKDFINDRKWSDKQVLMPKGVRIAVSSGPAFNDTRLIWSTLDKIRAGPRHGADPWRDRKRRRAYRSPLGRQSRRAERPHQA